jgi:hypothetical protein
MVAEGLLDNDAAAKVTEALAAGKPLDDALRAAGSEDKVLRFLAAYFDVPFVDLEKDGATYAPPKDLLAKFPARILLDRQIIPLSMNGSTPGEGIPVLTTSFGWPPGSRSIRCLLRRRKLIDSSRSIWAWVPTRSSRWASMTVTKSPSLRITTTVNWIFPTPPMTPQSSSSSIR